MKKAKIIQIVPLDLSMFIETEEKAIYPIIGMVLIKSKDCGNELCPVINYHDEFTPAKFVFGNYTIKELS